MAAQPFCILINGPSQQSEGLNEQVECRSFEVATAMSGSIAATPTALALSVLDAEGAAFRPGGQVAEHCKGEGAGEFMQLFRLHLIQLAAEELQPEDQLLAAPENRLPGCIKGCCIDGCCSLLQITCPMAHNPWQKGGAMAGSSMAPGLSIPSGCGSYYCRT